MVVEWEELTDRYRNAVVGQGPRDPAPSQSLLSLVWAEWKGVYAPHKRRDRHQWHDLIVRARVEVGVDATSLDEVLSHAAQLLAPATGKPEAELRVALQK